MTNSLGRITARLADPDEIVPPELVALINENIAPPIPVTGEDVFVRAMYVVSDKVNSFGGRFPVDEHDHLARLLIDSPVLIGHRRDLLPVGRTFHAERVEHNGAPWVKAYFYWLRASDDADTLRENIDGGIYKECSIAFSFQFPECSVCGEDIRRCEHEPFETYGDTGASAPCHFNYRQIEKVLETSLVYRGAVPDTSITRNLNSRADDLPVLSRLDTLDRHAAYLIVPRYDGITVMARVDNAGLRIARLDGTPIELRTGDITPRWRLPEKTNLYGRLVAYRGRERCSRVLLRKYLSGQASQVSRLVLYLYPLQGLVKGSKRPTGERFTLAEIPYRVGSMADFEPLAGEIATRDGVEVWSIGPSGCFFDGDLAVGYRYPTAKATSDENFGYTLFDGQAEGVAWLELSMPSAPTRPAPKLCLQLKSYDMRALLSGRKLLACRVSSLPPGNNCHAKSDSLIRLEAHGAGFRFETRGHLTGRWVLRPILLNGSNHFLFYADRTDQTQLYRVAHGR
jgi:hypothetical protein